MSDIDKVMIHTRRLESLLKEQYRAQGDNLSELVESCMTKIPNDIAMKIQDLWHRQQEERLYENNEELIRLCLECEKALTPRANRLIWSIAILLVLLMTVGALVFYGVHWETLTDYFEKEG